MQLHVVRVGLPLVPGHALDVIAPQRKHARLEHVCGFIGVALDGEGVGVGDVEQGPSACPRLSEVAMIPVAEDNREVPFERSTVNPRFGGRSAHGVTNDTNGYPQTVGQHTAEVIGDGRETFDRRFVRSLPRPYLQ